MEINVRGKHFEVPDHVQERARVKLTKLAHYLPLLEDAAVEVDLTHQKAKEPAQRYLVRVIISAHGVHLQAEEHAARPETALDQAVQVLTRQARQHKDRLYERGRGIDKEAVVLAEEPVAAEDAGPANRVARIERVAIKPMSVGEAVEQLDALGDSFFLFHDADAGQIALLYRRDDGTYALIVPELS